MTVEEVIDGVCSKIQMNNSLDDSIKEKKIFDIRGFSSLLHNMIHDNFNQSLNSRPKMKDVKEKVFNFSAMNNYDDFDDEIEISNEIKIVNKIGNNPLNVHKPLNVITAAQGDMVYMSLNKGIFKFNNNNTKIIRIYDGQAYLLNVIGEWIFFTDTSSIYKIKINGKYKTQLYDLGKVFKDGNGSIRSMIVVNDTIYFSGHGWGGKNKPFVAQMSILGNDVKYIYKLDDRYMNDEDCMISIISADERYLYCDVYSNTNFRFMIDMLNSKKFLLSSVFDYKKILDCYPDEDYTEREIKSNFDKEVDIIDFQKGLVYLKRNYFFDEYYGVRIGNGEKVKVGLDVTYQYDGFGRPNVFPRYFNGKTDIGFIHRNLISRMSDGSYMEFELHEAPSASSEIHVTDEYVYYDYSNAPTRINIHDGKEQSFDLHELIIKDKKNYW